MRRSSGSSSEPKGTTRPPCTSSRWLSMIRRAAAACSGLTATRRSQPWSLRTSGKRGARVVAEHGGRDVVRLEQAANHACLDLGRGAEDDDEIAHTATLAAAAK